MRKKTWLLVMRFNDRSGKEIKTIYRKKRLSAMKKDIDLFQDMNPDLILQLFEIDKKSTYDNVIGKNGGLTMFVDCKNNWSDKNEEDEMINVASKEIEIIENALLEEEILKSVITGSVALA
jgi:hypothetical protein|tara:strand:- start:1155 stop:1517 length:363 start_codon:yes stop_codon:yes gene_type:complete